MGFFSKYAQRGFWENRQVIRKFVMISIHAGASGLSIFMAMNLPGEEVYSGFDRLPRSKSHPEDGIYSGLIPQKFLLCQKKEKL